VLKFHCCHRKLGPIGNVTSPDLWQSWALDYSRDLNWVFTFFRAFWQKKLLPAFSNHSEELWHEFFWHQLNHPFLTNSIRRLFWIIKVRNGRHGVPVHRWTWTGLPGWRPSTSRRDSWSTTSAVTLDFNIGWSTNTTVHCWRPSVPCRCCTNMEQFASSSDVIKFPANLQN